jgi:hypothetical protein
LDLQCQSGADMLNERQKVMGFSSNSLTSAIGPVRKYNHATAGSETMGLLPAVEGE